VKVTKGSLNSLMRALGAIKYSDSSSGLKNRLQVRELLLTKDYSGFAQRELGNVLQYRGVNEKEITRWSKSKQVRKLKEVDMKEAQGVEEEEEEESESEDEVPIKKEKMSEVERIMKEEVRRKRLKELASVTVTVKGLG